MKKKVLLIATFMLIFIFVLSLVGCSTDSGANNDGNNSYNAIEKPNLPSDEGSDDNNDIITKQTPFEMVVSSIKVIGTYDSVEKEYKCLIPIDSDNIITVLWNEIDNKISVLFSSDGAGIIMLIDKNLGPSYTWALLQGKYTMGGTVSFLPYTGANIKYLNTNIPTSMGSLISSMKNLAKVSIELCCNGLNLYFALAKLDLDLSDFNIYI